MTGGPSRQLRRRGRRAGALGLISCALVIAWVAPLHGSTAHAQAVGGTVLPEIALSIGTPSDFQAVGRGNYELRVPVQVTASVGDVRLCVSDGQDATGAAHGRARDAAGLALAPLSVSVLGEASQSLAAPVDPLLKIWDQPVALAPATIVVRQQLRSSLRTVSPLHKLILISVSSATP